MMKNYYPQQPTTVNDEELYFTIDAHYLLISKQDDHVHDWSSSRR